MKNLHRFILGAVASLLVLSFSGAYGATLYYKNGSNMQFAQFSFKITDAGGHVSNKSLPAIEQSVSVGFNLASAQMLTAIVTMTDDSRAGVPPVTCYASLEVLLNGKFKPHDELAHGCDSSNYTIDMRKIYDGLLEVQNK